PLLVVAEVEDERDRGDEHEAGCRDSTKGFAEPGHQPRDEQSEVLQPVTTLSGHTHLKLLAPNERPCFLSAAAPRREVAREGRVDVYRLAVGCCEDCLTASGIDDLV